MLRPAGGRRAARSAAATSPCALRHVEDAQGFGEAVAERGIGLQPVAVRAHAAVAQQVAEVLHREQVLAGGDGHGGGFAQHGVGLVVERIDRLLEPAQPIGLHGPRVGQRGVEVEAAVGIDGEVLAAAGDLEHPLDALEVVGQRRAADLHLQEAVAELAAAAHLVLQALLLLAGVVVAAAGIDQHALVDTCRR